MQIPETVRLELNGAEFLDSRVADWIYGLAKDPEAYRPVITEESGIHSLIELQNSEGRPVGGFLLRKGHSEAIHMLPELRWGTDEIKQRSLADMRLAYELADERASQRGQALANHEQMWIWTFIAFSAGALFSRLFW